MTFTRAEEVASQRLCVAILLTIAVNMMTFTRADIVNVDEGCTGN